MDDTYSTNQISEELVEEIKTALANKEYGSIEIYVESGRVVQITERVIKKTPKFDNTNKREFVYWKPIKNRK